MAGRAIVEGTGLDGMALPSALWACALVYGALAGLGPAALPSLMPAPCALLCAAGDRIGERLGGGACPARAGREAMGL